MKRTVFLVLGALLAAGLIFTACPSDEVIKYVDKTPPWAYPADYGENLITEAAILSATGTGVTGVRKVYGGYEVTGTVTAYSNWDHSVNDNRIALNIQADPADPNCYFAQANRYTITIDFPNSAVKPIPEYTDGFRIYLENNQETVNTPIWSGTWAREWPDEYNAIGGIGKMSINRDLTIDPNVTGSVSNVGDYQYLALVLGFDAAHLGTSYKFIISNVGVFADGIDDVYPPETPVIHDSAQLDDAIYDLNDTADTLGLVGDGSEHALVTWTPNSASYVFKWYLNTTNSDTGGEEITDGALFNWNHAGFTPPTNVAGTFYYYVVISYTDAITELTSSVTSRVVTITVN